MPTAVDRSYRTIKIAILDGSLGRGTHLKEEELAERVGVSRTPVREALRRLDADGLVRYQPNHGAFVSSWDDDELDEIFALRNVLETFGVERAARNIGPEQIRQLRELTAQMDAAAAEDTPASRDLIADLNVQFHKQIYQTAGSKRLENLLTVQIEMPVVLRTFHHFTPEQIARSLLHHHELIAALSARDPVWAAAVMRCHLLAARATYLHDHEPDRPGADDAWDDRSRRQTRAG